MGGIQMNGILIRGMENQQPIELIYMGADGKLSQRIIRVLSITDTHVKAYCYSKRKLRTFRKENILSGQIKKGIVA